MSIDVRAVAAAKVRGAQVYGTGVLPRRGANVRFAIVASPRTGSELLVRLLDSHPDIRCDSEILHLPPRWPVRFLEGHAALAARAGARGYGFKLLVDHVAAHPALYKDEAFLATLRARGWRLVHLRRRDLLLQALSYLQAVRHGFHHTEGSAAIPRIRVDPAELLTVMANFEEAATWAAAVVGTDAIEVSYEEDLEDPHGQQDTVDRIARSLHLPPAPTSTDLVRGGPPDARARVENYDEISSTLARSRFAHFVTST